MMAEKRGLDGLDGRGGTGHNLLQEMQTLAIKEIGGSMMISRSNITLANSWGARLGYEFVKREQVNAMSVLLRK
jgi:hypothetical protein